MMLFKNNPAIEWQDLCCLPTNGCLYICLLVSFFLIWSCYWFLAVLAAPYLPNTNTTAILEFWMKYKDRGDTNNINDNNVVNHNEEKDRTDNDHYHDINQLKFVISRLFCTFAMFFWWLIKMMLKLIAAKFKTLLSGELTVPWLVHVSNPAGSCSLCPFYLIHVLHYYPGGRSRTTTMPAPL